MVKPHEPKLHAIRAEAAGLLSAQGRQRLAHHVEGCSICAEHLRGARRFAVLMGRPSHMPAFDGADVAHRARVASLRAQRRIALSWGGAGLAAAAAALLFFALSREPLATEVATLPPRAGATDAPHGALPESDALLDLRITALGGTVRAIDRAAKGAAPRALELDSELAEGVELETLESSELDLALGSAGALRFDSDTRASLIALREHQLLIELYAGQVSNAVEPRSADQSYAVRAKGHLVSVHGTLFAVAISSGGELSVQCDEGSVTVTAPDGQTTSVLRAPARWSESGGLTSVTTTLAQGLPHRRVARPHALAEGSVVLELPSLPALVGWEIAGQSHPGALRMRVPVGELELTAKLANGRHEPVRLKIDPLGKRVSPQDLAFARAHEPAPAAASSAVIGDASAVIRAARPALQRCYERSLKNESSGSLSMRLSVELDQNGRVRNVESKIAEGGTEKVLPAALAQCIESTVRSFKFPPPGEAGARIEAPLRFQLRR